MTFDNHVAMELSCGCCQSYGHNQWMPAADEKEYNRTPEASPINAEEVLLEAEGSPLDAAMP